MALFNKEPDRNVRTQQPVRQQTQPSSPSASPVSPTTIEERPVAQSRSNGQAQAILTSAESRAYLDKGAKISGKLYFEGPIRIDGQVEGEIQARDTITIGEGAVVTAQTRAAAVVIAGKVNGDIIATERIEIRPSARVTGNVVTPVLVVHEGAIFEGRCSMQPESVREEKKTPIVPVTPKEERITPQVAHKPAIV